MSALAKRLVLVGIMILGIASAPLVGGGVEAREARKPDLKLIEDSGDLRGDLPASPVLRVAQAGTTWIGWRPGAYDPVTNPHSIGAGYWDFDDRGTRSCPVEDDYHEYIKNGAYAQGWISEDVLAQKGIYWHAEDFSDAGFACQGNSALNGIYSAWCGVISISDPYLCFTAAPGYGSNWNQWLCRTVANPTGLEYAFKSDTEVGFDYAYTFIDAEYPDSCGWVGDEADTLRCYTGTNDLTTETLDLTNLPGADPDFCPEESNTTPDYSADTVKICFVVITDSGWDDQDGNYDACDGAFTVDDIVVATTAGEDTTDFESGTLEGWTACGGFSPGDYVAIRHRSSFTNRDDCGFDNCTMSDCVLTYYNPDIPGMYGTGGHFAGDMHKRAWSPTVNLSNYPPRGYVMKVSRYRDRPISEWIFSRFYFRYVQDPDCPTGAWSVPVTDGYIYWINVVQCEERYFGFSYLVPQDADSVQIGYSVWNGCNVWETPCRNGNQSPVIDNVTLGVYDLSSPQASIRAVDNYTDSWPEADLLTAGATALIDAANNKSQTGAFLRLADSAVIELNAPNVEADLCFRIEPGPGADLADPFFTTKYPDAGGWTACELSDDVFCTRMDTAFAAGDGDPASDYEYQVTFEDYYATMIHEYDPLYAGEGEEIFPDSLFTAGTKIYYAFRTNYVGSAICNWLPFGADLANDPEGTAFEVMVNPDLCKDPAACLLYVDYYNRGAQGPIENALTLLGRTWDRFDMRAESSHQANGIGNRLLGPGRYRLARGPIGPSLDHLGQYTVMLINSGSFYVGECFSDGGTGTPDDPSNDVQFLDNWLNEGRYKGLWLNGDNIAHDFATATSGPKPSFLNRELATDLVSGTYRVWSGHPLDQRCTFLTTADGEMKVVNKYSLRDSLLLYGSGCPTRYSYDVIKERDGEAGREFVSVMYEGSGGYASVDHVYKTVVSPFDSVRTKIDGFSLHNLRYSYPDCGTSNNIGIAWYMRDVLGGENNDGWFYDTDLGISYCLNVYPEDPTVDAPLGGGTSYSNALFQNYPNPFRGGMGTTIHYSVATAGPVRIRVYDAAGRLVKTLEDKAQPGDNFLIWDGVGSKGRAAPSGVYFYQIVKDGYTAHRKMLLLR